MRCYALLPVVRWFATSYHFDLKLGRFFRLTFSTDCTAVHGSTTFGRAGKEGRAQGKLAGGLLLRPGGRIQRTSFQPYRKCFVVPYKRGDEEFLESLKKSVREYPRSFAKALQKFAVFPKCSEKCHRDHPLDNIKM